MKNKHLGWNMKFLIAAIFSFLLILSFNACKNADDEKNEDPPASGKFTWDTVFLPTNVDKDDIVATYTGTGTLGTEQGTYAVYLTDDNRYVETCKTSSSETVVRSGTYTISTGDLTNGTLAVTITEQNGVVISLSGTITIVNGSFSGASGGVSYTKQDTSPATTDGSVTGVTVPSDVYYPTSFKTKTVSALYKYSANSVNYAVFFFSDNTYLSTSYTINSQNSTLNVGRMYYKGSWVKTTGNFKTGSFTLTRTDYYTLNAIEESGSWTASTARPTGNVTVTNSSFVCQKDSDYELIKENSSTYTLVGSTDSQSGTASGASATLTDPSVSGTYNLLTWTDNTYQGTINFSTNSMTWNGETGSQSFSYSNGVLTTTYDGQNYTAYIKSLSDGKIVFLEPLTRTSGSGLYATFTERNGTDTITLNPNGTFTIGDDSGTWSNSNGIIETVIVYFNAGTETHLTLYYLYDGTNFYDLIGILSK